MKLIFDSATEYFDFLDMQQQIFGRRPVPMVEGPSQPISPAVESTITEHAALADLPGVQKLITQAEQAADKPKRTRKPKAGDAPMAEQNAAQWPSSPTLGEMQAGQPVSVTIGQPGDAQIVASAEGGGGGGSGQSVTIQLATAEVHAAFAEQAQAAAGAIDPAKLAERVAALGVVDPAKHLTAARMFIAAHQLPAYHQVQRDAGLPDDIIGYTDEQRTTHMAAMELFNEAHDLAQVQK